LLVGYIYIMRLDFKYFFLLTYVKSNYGCF
jgi:hypothetical protein